jgi:hypothetical protein
MSLDETKDQWALKNGLQLFRFNMDDGDIRVLFRRRMRELISAL